MFSVISLLCFLFSALEIQNQYVDILDFIAGNIVVSDAKKNWGGGGGSSASQPIVSVALKMDKERYVLGEEIIYEISVKNISGKEIQIPWDTDGDKINNGDISYSYEDLPAGFMSASAGVWLRNDDNSKNDSILKINGLYGSNAFASSIKVLKPEESVMIRAAYLFDRGDLNSSAFDRTNDNLSIILEIYAKWMFSYGIDVMAFNQMTDSTSIQIEFEIPPDEETE